MKWLPPLPLLEFSNNKHEIILEVVPIERWKLDSAVADYRTNKSCGLSQLSGCLLQPDVTVCVDLPAPEDCLPVGVGPVDHQQGEVALLVVGGRGVGGDRRTHHLRVAAM